MAIRLKASTYVGKEVELYKEVKFIAAKLKSARGESMLEADTEYLALIVKHLPKDSVKDWIKTGKLTKSEFYEQTAKVA